MPVEQFHIMPLIFEYGAQVVKADRRCLNVFDVDPFNGEKRVNKDNVHNSSLSESLLN